MLVRIVANAIKPQGGGEMSMQTTVRLLTERGHRVVWHPTTEHPWPWPLFCEVGLPFGRNPYWDCDLLFYLTNNTTLPLSDLRRVHGPVDPGLWRRATSKARTSVLHINWEVIGDAVKIADQFDRFAFLSTWLRHEFLRLTGIDGGRTWVHCSAVDLAPYLECVPDFSQLVIARHSTGGKWPIDSPQTIREIARLRPDASFRLMGLHPRMEHRVRSLPRTALYPAGSVPPPRFLDGCSLFLYPLKPEYREQGPRTIVEAMAAGLPCAVDDRDGPSDRVTPETGWRIARHEDYPALIAGLSLAEIRDKGEAARERARAEFQPADWADWLEEVAVVKVPA